MILAFSGQASQRISISGGTESGTAGVSNRGLGNEGLYIQAGKEYEGYFFASSAKAVSIEARIETTDGKVLASQIIQHLPGNGSFEQHKFTLTPADGTECVGIEPGSNPSVHCTPNQGPHICVQCGGQFTVALVATADDTEANIDFVIFQPGEWGRFKGLNARRDVAESLEKMGIKAIRLGGSFCSVTKDSGEYYQWQKWTGPIWNRPDSIGAHWDSYNGKSYNLIGGWGPFEAIDYAVALGAEPIITTTMTSTPEEFADLVEYCWANESFPMGQKRISDGHPEEYELRYIELGNEQYNPNYVEQVAAMEARANEVGAAGQLHYMFPLNGGLTGGDLAKAAALKLGSRLVTDLHVGAGGALPVADQLFAAHTSGGLSDDAAVNFETNAATHDHARALNEASDLNDFFNAGNPRMLARTASFCHGRSGHYDMFDQAISFFLPNMTWLQPPGHVHAMITESWMPHVLNTTLNAPTIKSTWTTIPGKQYTCSSSEYQGDLGVTTEQGCLKAAQNKQGVNFATWQAVGNQNCYVCSIPGDPSTWKLNNNTNDTVFEGKNVLPTMSVSAQQSTDGETIVARIVNHGPAMETGIRLTNFEAAHASAVSMSSSDPAADNTPSNVDRVAPVVNKDCAVNTEGVVTVGLPGSSYTVVTIVKKGVVPLRP